MSENVNIDDALVEEVARVLLEAACADADNPMRAASTVALSWATDRAYWTGQARAVLAHLAPRLLPAGMEEQFCVMHDGHPAFGWVGLSRYEAESKIADLEDDGAVPDAFVVGRRVVGPWREVEA